MYMQLFGKGELVILLLTDSSAPEFKGRKFQDTVTDWADTGWVVLKVHFSLTLVPLTTSSSLEV